MDKKIKISEKDLYCVAKLLQGSIFAKDRFRGCEFCKHSCLQDGKNVNPLPNYDKIIFRLQDITGVDFGVWEKSVVDRLKNDKAGCGDDCF